MRRKVHVFIAMVLCILMIAPLVNVLSGSAGKSGSGTARNLWPPSAAALYNLDFVFAWFSRMLHPLGISASPSQVVIGRNGWLFLGDRYGSTLTRARRGQTASDITVGRQIGKAAAAWDRWMQQKGVRLYRVMLAPNKDTIYSELLPEWAKPSKPSATDALILGTGRSLYIDLRPELTSARSQHKEALYYRTDTHWNSLGAALAFEAFAREVGRSEPLLRWPFAHGIRVNQIIERQGGDLARFLRMADDLSFREPQIFLPDVSPPETIHYDLNLQKRAVTADGPRKPGQSSIMRVTSVQALNMKKVLWLRDSFGEALNPFMAVTFQETIQLHWIDALSNGGRLLVDLVERWQPDYVFVTVVERDALSASFSTLPPES